MSRETRPETTVIQPPGWEMKRVYWRNLLLGDLIVLVVATILVALSAFLQQTVPLPDRADQVPPGDPFGDALVGEFDGATGDRSSSRAGASPYREAMTIRLTRFIVIPDEPDVFTSSELSEVRWDDQTPRAPESYTQQAAGVVADYLSRVSGISPQSITGTTGSRRFLDLLPIGSRHSRGFGSELIYSNDIVKKPIIDVRGIRSPLLDKYRDTATVMVDMLLGPDTLDILVVEEHPLFKGYGDLVREGLLRGKHIPMMVNDQPRTTQVLLTVYICLNCKEINLAAQTVEIRY